MSSNLKRAFIALIALQRSAQLSKLNIGHSICLRSKKRKMTKEIGIIMARLTMRSMSTQISQVLINFLS